MTSGTRTTANLLVEREGDTTIRYTASGPVDGKTLVLIHGWACNRRDFDALTGHLPEGWRVLAVDLAEHGESRSAREAWTIEEFARDVAAVLAAEAVASCVVVGHSLGGAVAVEVGRLLPDTVSQVIALDALHYLFLFPAQHPAQRDALMGPFHADFAGALRAMIAAGSPPGSDPALAETYFRKMVAVRQPAGLRAIEGLVQWDMDAALGEVRQPITVFAVRAMLGQEAIDRYAARFRFVPVDLGTHHFPVESPAETARLLVDVVGA